jgi:hypothetical protein
MGRLVLEMGASIVGFDQPTPLFLGLAQAHTYPTGTAIQVYRPRRAA